jgi:ribose/xylose/arabinose/galactoside ABC-type transport system permease subunit
VGALGRVMLLSIIGSVVNLLGVSVWYQQLLKGAIIPLGAAACVGRRELARERAPAPRIRQEKG